MSSPKPSTPASQSVNPAVQSTPHSQGSGSHQAYHTSHTQEDYKPFLAYDIKHELRLTVAHFLDYIFGLELDRTDEESVKMQVITQDPKYLDSLAEYLKSIRETDRYHPFVTLANIVTKKLGFDVYFCRNDPTYVSGSAAERKPDVTGVHTDVIDGVPDRDSVDNCLKEGPKEFPFFWHDLKFFVEFKRKEKEVSVPISLPSSSTATGSNTAAKQSSGTSRQSQSNAPESQMTNGRKRKRQSAVAVPSGSSSKKRKANTNKELKDSTMENVKIQCASYALEMLSHGGPRTHVYGALVEDRHIYLLYYDHSACIRSDPLDFVTYPHRFISVLYALVKGPSEHYDQMLTGPRVDHSTLHDRRAPLTNLYKGQIMKLNNGANLFFGGVLFYQHGLIGRGTCVLNVQELCGTKWAEEMNGDHPRLVVKLSYLPATRKSESEILNYVMGMADIKETSQWVLNHLPTLVHWEKVEIPLWKRLAEHFIADEYELRDLHVSIFEELHPITELVEFEDVKKVYCDIFKCYRWLYEVVGILHRDISLNNMMYRRVNIGESYTICGVLNDYDLAVNHKAEGCQTPSSKQRTGTQPYMAIDLLEDGPVLHLYRHDLESMFYVLVCHTTRYHNGRLIDNPPLQTWFELGRKELLKEKGNFFARGRIDHTANFKNFFRWTLPMTEIFNAGYRAQTNHRMLPDEAGFDEQTLGGRVDFDEFSKIFM